MRIAVTGGSGGIGRAVTAEALRQGHSVVSIDRVAPAARAEGAVEFIQAELTDYEECERAFGGCDALVHLAAIPAPIGFPDHVVHNNNVVSSYNALRAAAAVGIQRVCQASSVNALGLSYSRWATFDYFPIDEQHPTHNEDPYSLSKWICEQQADSIVRRFEDMVVASLRFHWVVADRAVAAEAAAQGGPESMAMNLWAYTNFDAAARACLLALRADFAGHEAFYIAAPDTCLETPSLELAQRFYPAVPVRGDLSGNRSFFDSSKAERLLGWRHDRPEGDEQSHAHPARA